MKALFCGKCFDIRALDPEGEWTVCHCGNVQARWHDPGTGTVRVKARVRSVARIIGFHNGMLRRSINGPTEDEVAKAGDSYKAWRQLHDDATNAKGYIFDKSFRGCWACMFEVGATGDVKWDDDPQVPLVAHVGMNPGQTWQSLGTGYPGIDPCTMAAFDVLAPVNGAARTPVYLTVENQGQPTPDQVWALADQLVYQIARAVP